MTDQDFDAVYRTHRLLVIRAVAQVYRQCPDTEDVQQRVWLKVWQKLDTFRGESSLGTWIYHVAVNEARMAFRSDKSRHAIPGDLHSLDAIPVDVDGVATPIQIPYEDSTMRAIPSQLTIRTLMEKLPRGYREFITTRYLDGLDTEETADKFRCSQEMVKTRVYRGLRELRTLARGK